MTTTDEARGILTQLLTTPDAQPLTDPVAIGRILAEAATAYHQVCVERDELAARITAARQDAFPYLRERSQRGELALNVEAALDPRPERAA